MDSAVYFHLRQNPKSKLFPPVFPMVFYHGKSRWNIPDDFASLTGLEDDSPLREYIPQFRFRVYDISHLPDAEIRGKVMEKSVLMVAKHIFLPDLRHKLPEMIEKWGIRLLSASRLEDVLGSR